MQKIFKAALAEGIQAGKMHSFIIAFLRPAKELAKKVSKVFYKADCLNVG